MLLVIYKVPWLESLSLVKIIIISHGLARNKLVGRKFMKMRKKKLKSCREALCIKKRFDRE